jgi:hypothetical protein
MSEEPDSVHPKPEPSRALIPVGGARESAPGEAIRPLATFIAQMLACRATVPDFRQNRRAEPTTAAASYAAAHDVWRPGKFQRML